MKLTRKIRESRSGGLIGAALTVVLGLIFLFPFGLHEPFENVSYEWPFAFRPKVTAQELDEVCIIYMDDDSHIQLSQEKLAAWNRSVHARLIDRLKPYNVKAIGFDILFEEMTPETPALVKAVRDNGHVVLAGYLHPKVLGDTVMIELKKPHPDLQAVSSWGISEGSGEDRTIRQHFMPRNDMPQTFSLAWKLAELSHSNAIPQLSKTRWINYYGRPGLVPSLSYIQVLPSTNTTASPLPLSVLSNKVIFVGTKVGVGYSGGKGTDDFRTPYSLWTRTRSPGVEVNATAYLNLVRQDWLERIAPLPEFLLVVGLGSVLGFGLCLLRPIPAVLVSVAGLLTLFAAACIGAWSREVWFDWAVIGFVQIPCAAACAVLFDTQKLYKEKAALETRLAGQVTPISPRSPFPAFGPQAAASPGAGSPMEEIQTIITPQSTPSGWPAIPDCSLLKRVGAGAYGEVWLAKTVLGYHRALKIVYRSNFTNEHPYEREFQGIKHFDPISRHHPGLVQILHVGRNDTQGFFYYLMELADDLEPGRPFAIETFEPKTLGKVIGKHGRLSVDHCLALGLDLTDSLYYLHQSGLIHRDIKPSNIIYVRDRAKLADIGLVTEIGEQRSFVGTEGFYPPEGPGNPTADIFSLGKVLYEATMGLGPDRFPELPTKMDEFSSGPRLKAINRIILKACDNDPSIRYQTAKNMWEDLKKVEAGDLNISFPVND